MRYLQLSAVDAFVTTKKASYNVIHTLGAPVDFNGNISRTLGEAIPISRLGIKVSVVVSNKVPKNCFEQAADNNVNLSLFSPPLPPNGIGWRLNNTLPLYLAILNATHNNPNCILHVSAPSPVTKPFMGLAAGKQTKKPIVLDLHDPWSDDLFSHNPLLMLQTTLMRKVIDKADFVIAAHNQLAKLVRSLNNKKPLTVIPNCVDCNQYKPTDPNKSFAKELGITDDEIVVAFCGHITEFKGLQVLVKSAKKVVKKVKNIKFLIIGDGPFLQHVKELTRQLDLEKFFKFVGYVSQKQLPLYLCLADICVAPYTAADFYKLSLPETPVKVVEYIAMGKPVIMSKISEQNVITWSEGGVQIQPGNVDELADGLIDLICDEKLRKTMGAKGRNYAEENLSWDKMALKLVEIYESVH